MCLENETVRFIKNLNFFRCGLFDVLLIFLFAFEFFPHLLIEIRKLKKRMNTHAFSVEENKVSVWISSRESELRLAPRSPTASSKPLGEAHFRLYSCPSVCLHLDNSKSN